MGLVGGGLFIDAIVSSNPWVLPAVLYFGGFATGVAILSSKPQYQYLYYDIDEAKEKIANYNQKLKNELELPANYEPK